MEIAIVAIIVTTASALLALRAARQLQAGAPRRACCSAEQGCGSCAESKRTEKE